MKPGVYFAYGVVFLISCVARGDDAQPPKELLDLQSKYQSDVQDAISPLKERYRGDLKDLLQTEMAKGDAEAVAAVQKEIQTLEAGYPFAGKWTSHSYGDSIIRFKPEGGWSEDWNANTHYDGHWRAQGPLLLVVTRSDGLTMRYQLNDSGHLIRDIGGVDYERNPPSNP